MKETDRFKKVKQTLRTCYSRLSDVSLRATENRALDTLLQWLWTALAR